jgi:uncharacterized protein YjbI with pentapeptide repeats
MQTQIIEMTQFLSYESYQMVKDEHLSFVVISNQILSGSHISQSTYRNVVFSDCKFYACDFNDILFSGCVFENCTFEFSHFRKCQLTNCNFSHCSFQGASSIGSFYLDCDLGAWKHYLEEREEVSYLRHDFTTDIYIQLAAA